MKTLEERKIGLEESPEELRESEALNLLHYFRILNRWKAKILVAAFLAATVSFLTSFWSPRMYVATATIFASRDSSVIGTAASRLLGMPNFIAGGASMEIIPPMIRSRRMIEDIVEHFQLGKFSPGAPKSALLNRVRGMIRIYDTEKRALYAVEVRHEDPKLAADIANFAVENLDRLNEELKVTSEKPIVRLLDSAIPPSDPESRRIIQKMFVSSLVVGFIVVLYAFLTDYLHRLRRNS